MTLVKVCPICYRGYSDTRLIYCREDGSELSQPFELPLNTDEPEVETVILNRKSKASLTKPPKATRSNSYKNETDGFIETAVRKHKTIAFHVNSGNEHCVELVGRERRGSLWIRPRYKGYRLQTTGQAQKLDNYIEQLCGSPEGSAKPNVYKYWYIESASDVEKIIARFAALA